MFKALSAKGTPMPPELQGVLQTYMDANPDAKAKIEDAMRKGGDVTAAQEELNRQVVQLISENPGEFSEEDLATLLTATESAPAGTKGSDVTVDAIQKAIADHRAGRSPASSGTGKSEGGGTGKSEGGGTGKSEGGPAPAAARRQIRRALAVRPRVPRRCPAARRVACSTPSRAHPGPAPRSTTRPSIGSWVSSSRPGSRRHRSTRSSPGSGPPPRRTWTSSSGSLRRPSRKSAPAQEGRGTGERPGRRPRVHDRNPGHRQDRRFGRSDGSRARQADVSALSPGESYFPLPDPLKVGAERDVRHIAKIAGGAAVGNGHIRIVSFTDTTVSVLFALSTDMYDGQGKVVLSASALVGNVVTARCAGGKKSK